MTTDRPLTGKQFLIRTLVGLSGFLLVLFICTWELVSIGTGLYAPYALSAMFNGDSVDNSSYSLTLNYGSHQFTLYHNVPQEGVFRPAVFVRNEHGINMVAEVCVNQFVYNLGIKSQFVILNRNFTGRDLSMLSADKMFASNPCKG